MRIWSVHPRYLDTKGLVALWRETLLAKNVLELKTRGYKNHPQLIRFKQAEEPLQAINQYLSEVYKEALNRGYNFNKSKFIVPSQMQELSVTAGQMEYEIKHLLRKLETRDFTKYEDLLKQTKIEAHPLFSIIEGEIEDWEIV